MLIAYAGKDAFQVLRVSKETVEKIGSGSVDQMKPFRSLGKKVLVIGRDNYLHLRKRYPPTTAGDLKKVVALEIEDLFPVKNPAHAFRVFEKTASYTLVDIWSWERPFTDGIRVFFPYTHIVPEEAIFFSDEPEIAIEINNGHTHMIASSPEGYIGSEVIDGLLSPEQLKVFLKSLGRRHDIFKKLVFFEAQDQNALGVFKDLSLEIVVRDRPYPACIDSILRGNLREYAVKGSEFSDILPVAMRGVIFVLLGVAVSFFVTGRNYDKALVQMSKKISSISGDMAVLTSGPKKEDQEDVVKELKKKLAEGTSPLAVLDMIAGILPEKSNIVRIVLGDKNMEITIQDEDPLNLIKEVGKSDMVKALKLRGSPRKEQTKSVKAPQGQSKERYTFTLTVELK